MKIKIFGEEEKEEKTITLMLKSFNESLVTVCLVDENGNFSSGGRLIMFKEVNGQLVFKRVLNIDPDLDIATDAKGCIMEIV